MKKKGFTLIELIAAIAILSILAIIVAPNVLGKFNESRIKAMIIQESKLVESGTILVQDYCKNPINDDYKNKCSNVYANVSSIKNVKDKNNQATNLDLNEVINGATGTSGVTRKYVCVKDMKTLGYYSEKLKYGGNDCVGFVVYLIDNATNREVSSYSHIKCGNESYISGDNEIAEALKSDESELVSNGINELFNICSEGKIEPDGGVNHETNKLKLTVNYIDYESGMQLNSIEYTAYEGSPITINQEVNGYDLVGFETDIDVYNLDSSVVIDENRYIDLYFAKRYEGEVKYTINYWKQKVNAKGNEYNEENFEKVIENLELSAKPNIDIEVPLQSFEGFITPDNHVKIKPDGSSVFDFYFLRETYEISIDSNELGEVDKQKVYIKYETGFKTENNKLIFDDGQVVTATPKTTDGVENKFSHWNPSSGIIVDKTEIKAYFNLPNQYTVNYDCNGGTGSMSSSSFIANKKESLPANTCVFPGYTFDSWNTRADGKGDKYENEVENLCTSENCNVTLYAQWTPNTYYIEFHPNGGTGEMSRLNMTYGVPASLPANSFTNGSLSFIGWTGPNNQIFDNMHSSVSNLTTEPNGVVTLYARWGSSSYIEDFEDNTPNPYFKFSKFERMDIPNNPGFYPEDYNMGSGFYSPEEYNEHKYNSAAATFSFSFDAERSGTISITYGRANPSNNALGNMYGGGSGGAYSGSGNTGGGYDAGWGIVGLLDGNESNRLLYVSQCIESVESMCSFFGGNGQASDEKYGTKTVNFTAGHHDVEFTFLNWWGGGAFIDNITVVYN